MARKTRTCSQTLLQKLNGMLVMRTCILTRQHSGRCYDNRGAWSRTEAAE